MQDNFLEVEKYGEMTDDKVVELVQNGDTNALDYIMNKYNNIVNLNEVENYFDKVITTIIYVDKIKETNTSKGDKMAFINGSDELSNIDITLFPKVYENYKDISSKDIILVKGKVEKRFDKYQIIVNNITKL